MNRFKNILIYAGGSACPALERAAVLALRNGARLTLADVAAQGPAGLRNPWNPPMVDRRARLEELAAAVRQHGVDVKTRILTGTPSVELIREVRERGHDLVMKTAQELGNPLVEGVFGSTALHLLRQCPCPVWVVKPSEGSRGRIVAAIDPAPGPAASDDSLSRAVLELAASLARFRNLELDVVHAWWLPESTVPSPHFHWTAETMSSALAEARETAWAAVDKGIETVDLGGVRHQVHLSPGVPVEVLRAFSQRADLVVIGTLSRSGLAGVLVGNTSERILRKVDSSVLVVKPPGFAKASAEAGRLEVPPRIEVSQHLY